MKLGAGVLYLVNWHNSGFDVTEWRDFLEVFVAPGNLLLPRSGIPSDRFHLDVPGSLTTRE